MFDRPVRNRRGDPLGRIREIFVDLEDGRIAYALLAFPSPIEARKPRASGERAITGRDKLLLIPWSAFESDDRHAGLTLDVGTRSLARVRGYDARFWPRPHEIR